MDMFSYLMGKKSGGGGVTPTGTINITQNGETDVTNYATANVAVPEPTGTISITENGTVDVTNYASANVNVSGGGGGLPTAEFNDVNFYDYDGTIRYSYTASQFANLSAMPENPTHTGLTAKGWNWTLADAKNYVNECGRLNIGQMYDTTDGKTHIYIDLPEYNTAPYLGFAINGTATVEWGDGISENVTGTSTSTVIYTQHNYPNAGSYEIKISSQSTIYFSGNNTSGSYLLTNNVSGGNNSSNAVYRNSIKKIELGSNISLEISCFYYLTCMETIVLNTNLSLIPKMSFRHCYKLKHIVIPSGADFGVDSQGVNNMFQSDYNLKSASIPKSVTKIGNAFNSCYGIESVSIIGATSKYYMSSGLFNSCYSLKYLTLTTAPAELQNTTFYSCYSLSYIKMPNMITSIKSQMWDNCYSLKYVDFSNFTQIPTLDSSQSVPTQVRFIVPDNLYNTWITSGNWVSQASKIVKASEV